MGFQDDHAFQCVCLNHYIPIHIVFLAQTECYLFPERGRIKHKYFQSFLLNMQERATPCHFKLHVTQFVKFAKEILMQVMINGHKPQSKAWNQLDLKDILPQPSPKAQPGNSTWNETRTHETAVLPLHEVVTNSGSNKYMT